MRFRDFVVKTVLADTDWLVGYDDNGKYIRVPKAALGAGAGSSGGGSAAVAVQYSANGGSWHDGYTAGDCYMRITAGSGAWSDAVRICVSAYDIWLQQGNSGSEADFLASLKGEDGEDGAAGEPGANAEINPADLRIEELAGYEALLQSFRDALAEERAFVESVKAELKDDIDNNVKSALDSKLDKDLSNIGTAATISDGSYIPVVTDGDVKKVKMETVSAYTELRSTTGRQSSAGQGDSSQQPGSGGYVTQPSSGVFDVTVTPDLWEENDIWRYVAVVHDENAARLRSAFASPAAETLQEWSDCPVSLVSIEDGVLVFASPKALPTESITMKVYYKR